MFGILKGVMGIKAADYKYKAQALSADMQIEQETLALKDRIAARNQKLNTDLASIKAQQAALGVEGAQGIFEGQEKVAESDKRAERINSAQTIRNLQASKGFAKAEKQFSQFGSLIDIGSGIASSMSGMGA